MFVQPCPNRSLGSPPRRRAQEKWVLGRSWASPPASLGTTFDGEMSVFQLSGISVQIKTAIPPPHRLLSEAGCLQSPMPNLAGLGVPRAPRLQHLTPLTQRLHTLIFPALESQISHHQWAGKTRVNLWQVLIAGTGSVLRNCYDLGRSQHHLSQLYLFMIFRSSVCWCVRELRMKPDSSGNTELAILKLFSDVKIICDETVKEIQSAHQWDC